LHLHCEKREKSRAKVLPPAPSLRETAELMARARSPGRGGGGLSYPEKS
jgi:hypothetical protein